MPGTGHKFSDARRISSKALIYSMVTIVYHDIVHLKVAKSGSKCYHTHTQVKCGNDGCVNYFDLGNNITI